MEWRLAALVLEAAGAARFRRSNPRAAWIGVTHPGRSGTDRGSRDGADGIVLWGHGAKRGRRDGGLAGA